MFAPGKSRIVIDVERTVPVDKAFVLDPRDEQPARLVIDLVPTDEKTFLAKLKETKPETENPAPLTIPPQSFDASQCEARRGAGSRPWWPRPRRQERSRHAEKEVVLNFASVLKSKLEATGRYEIYLTREDDTFLLFASAWPSRRRRGRRLPVDSCRLLPARDRQDQAGIAKGATVYTLSEEASDEEARALAAKENFSDAVAGVALPEDSDEVLANILIDLAQRETKNRSQLFARSIVGELAGARRYIPSGSARRASAC